MITYRITVAKWAGSLRGSGYAARWNSNGNFMVYTASTRALACLENLVHRSGEALNQNFRIMEIEIPDMVGIDTLPDGILPSDWTSVSNYHITQQIGDDWLRNGKNGVLKVPSSIIPDEHNFLINPGHAEFTKIHITNTYEFVFDVRLRQDMV